MLYTDNSKVINTEIVDEMENSMLNYAMSVIVSRALPDVRDGLKPVHRRILYTLHENGLTPDKAYRTITWVIPDVDTNVVSENGGAVRADTYKMAFSTVVNVRHQILSDEKKHAHLRFNWKYRKSNSSTEYDAGWGENIEILASQLRNVYGSGATLASTVVYPYVYVLGAYDVITHDGATVTHDGETVYERSIYD